jgi:hypothetical protein
MNKNLKLKLKAMKTIKTIFVILLAVVTANVSLASGKVKFDKTTKDSEVAMADTSHVCLSQFEMDVKNSYGDVLYENTAIANSFKKKYDFSALEDGIYWMTVKIDKEKTVNKVEVKNGNVDMLEVRKSSEPYFDFKENKLKLTLLNHQNETVKMYVYRNGRSRTLLYKKDLGSDFAIHHGVDLSKLGIGSYEVILMNNRDIYDTKVDVE